MLADHDLFVMPVLHFERPLITFGTRRSRRRLIPALFFASMLRSRTTRKEVAESPHPPRNLQFKSR